MAKKKNTSADAPTESFEQSLSSLEAIVVQLEAGDLGLDESLTLFEEGVKLSRQCQTKLEAVERKVELVMQDAGGALKTAPLEGAADVADDEDDDDADDDEEPF